MAWGVAPDKYPYPDKKICEPLNRDLHYAIVHGELEGIAHPQKRHDRTRLQPLWGWLIKPERKDDPRWKPLRDFCQRWAKVRGERLVDTKGSRGLAHTKGKGEEPQPCRGRGRPSYREVIVTAYEELREAGKVDFGAPKKSLYQPIRKAISGESNTVPSGLGDEAIRATISSLFDADKVKTKPTP